MASLDSALDAFVAQTDELVHDCQQQQVEEIARHQKEANLHLERVKTNSDLVMEMAETIQRMERIAKEKEAEFSTKFKELLRQKIQENKEGEDLSKNEKIEQKALEVATKIIAEIEESLNQSVETISQPKFDWVLCKHRHAPKK